MTQKKVPRLKFTIANLKTTRVTKILSIWAIGLFVCLTSYNVYGQSYPTLEKVLAKELTKESQEDGKWVFYADKANIERVNNPLLKGSFPNYDPFRVTLTNYLGYHVNQGTCVVLFDSLKSKFILVEPMWYMGVSKPLIKLLIGRKFENMDTLLSVLKGVHDLLEIGSRYKFRNTSYSDSVITYDLGYFKGDSYTTGSNGTSSTVRHNEDGVWRKIIIDVKDLTIIRYTSVNPHAYDKEIIQ
jgi:hypothetical protein